MKLGYQTGDCIAALSTVRGKSALALIRISGNGCCEKIQDFIGIKDLKTRPRESRRTFFYRTEDRRKIDDILLTCFTGPNSYTGEDMIEIGCHGSMVIVHEILSRLLHCGFRQAEPGEFTFRAFVNGKLDLTQAEAVEEIISAKTPEASAMALSRLQGSISQTLKRFRDSILLLSAQIELRLDYGEDDIPDEPVDWKPLDDLILSIEALLSTYSTGRLYQEGAKIALCGATNAGKSSLFNRLLKEERSIVSDIHGTTRDYVQAGIDFMGIPIQLIDTAGLRSSMDLVEQEGIRRTRQIMSDADFILYLTDSTADGQNPDRDKLEPEFYDKTLFLWTKSDSGITAPKGYIPVSSLSLEGIKLLESALEERLLSISVTKDQVVLDSARQKQLLEQCHLSLLRMQQAVADCVSLDALAVDLQDAMEALGEITGEITREDVLDTLFSNFCVGK